MALDISFLSEAMPIWAFALVFVLAYAVLAKTKILGGNKWINSIISIILAIIFITFTSIREYLMNITPWFAVLLTLLFFFILIAAFATKEGDWSKIFKPTAIVFIILLVLVALIAIFYTFPATQALLPNAIINNDYYDSNYNNDYCTRNYEKTKVYDYDYYHVRDCDKKGDYYKCESDDNGKSEKYDRCIKYGSEYQCYDKDNWHYEYNYDNEDCDDNNNYRYNNDRNDIFGNIGDYIYQEKITNAFWLLLVAIIVGIIITRKVKD